ncbi:AraC-like DNA-binding protein [Pseudochelatococcus contaminans]|uniref:AraC-like DNA-binding protein n=2 Tax=Pseudochelatococcus contaminans TaxID=1538103 RepID=A0A7W5Z3I2_9HYPH|nr:AraC-like DNA-binding protein [Pseudochelatococcus contaminans]
MMHGHGNAPAAVTPIAFAIAITEAYALRGRSPEQALREARIAPRLLDDPQARITAQQFETLSGFAMRELDDEALGWFSRRLPWGSHGLLCRAAVTAPDLGIALRRWCRCHGLLTDDVRLSLTTKAGQACLTIHAMRIPDTLREFCMVSVLRMVHGFACWLVDSRIPLDDLWFPFARPAHAASYRAMFPGEARFEAETAGFSFDADYLALALVRDEAATRAMLQNALMLTVLQYKRDRLLVDRVRSLLKEHLRIDHLRLATAGLPTAETIAAALAISSRSLHRQLREEGASLQQIKDEVRRDKAMDLIQRSNRPLKQVAHLAGFRNEKSFSRAFRDWTGQSPGALRRG